MQSNTDGTNNTAVGSGALDGNTTGDGNVGVGRKAGDGGNWNTAVGMMSLTSNNGDSNTAVGYMSMYTQTFGGMNNTAIGYKSLYTNLSSDNNVAVGYGTLQSHTGGVSAPYSYATAVGYKALQGNTTGANNTAFGYFALKLNTIGSRNTGLGDQAGDVITEGNDNVLIGYNADPSANNASNQIVIGSGATGTGDNEIALGNSSISAIKAQVNSITAYSDRRIKREINDSKLGLDFIMNLRPVTYKMKNPADYPDELLEDRFRMDVTSGPNNQLTDFRPADDQTIYDGLIAQEVKEAIDEAGVNWSGWSENESDGKQGVQYGALTIPLIKAVQEQQETINSLKKVNQELSERLKAIEKALLR